MSNQNNGTDGIVVSLLFEFRKFFRQYRFILSIFLVAP
jgi:hypothetical protein